MKFNNTQTAGRCHVIRDKEKAITTFSFSTGSRCFYILIVFFALLSLSACKKAVEIGDPVNTITTGQAFTTEANATSALIQVYSSIMAGYNVGTLSYGNGLTTLLTGLSSDELNYFDGSNVELMEFQNNALQATNSYVFGALWSAAYKDIFYANAVIEGLQASTTVSDAVKKQLLGEAKFLRSFIFFYLYNLYGDIPLVTTTSWSSTSTIHRSSKSDVYKQIIQDLKEAEELLSADYVKSDNSAYPISSAERIRANKWVAKALLSKVYLYSGEWANAETYASQLINNSSYYSLLSNPNGVFLKNNTEAIWQLQITNVFNPYATREGNAIIPPSGIPIYYLTNQLLSAFELNDMRKTAWIDSIRYPASTGPFYYYPKKYKVRQGTANGNVTEYYMMLRLAEQYLIRAEARVQLNKVTEAESDLNTIRQRAGLGITTANDQPSLLLAIEHERQIEFFSEWGHRWFDLRRTGRANTVLGPLKGSNWQTTDQLFPIPLAEIQTNPNLSQNSGY